MHLPDKRCVFILPAVVAGCSFSTGSLSDQRPPLPQTSFEIASDARLDSTGRLQGSLVGEGTSRAVHLLSSDTALIANLIRTHRRGLLDRGGLWESLSRAGMVTIDPALVQPDPGRGPERILAASPAGHTEVRLASVVVRGSPCGWRGAQAEFIVESPPSRAAGPSLIGPVVGSFQGGSYYSQPVYRDPPEPPSPSLTDTLLSRTRTALAQAAEDLLREQESPFIPIGHPERAINTLMNVNAADIIPIGDGNGRNRYVVSLRLLGRTATSDTVMAATVMVWSADGSWRQTIFRPTLFDYQGGELLPRRNSAPVYWRRLQGISGFAYDRDYVWMEQVNPRDGTVLWGIVEPWSNVIVAAAQLAGPCM